jgi:hypothetical protein
MTKERSEQNVEEIFGIFKNKMSKLDPELDSKSFQVKFNEITNWLQDQLGLDAVNRFDFNKIVFSEVEFVKSSLNTPPYVCARNMNNQICVDAKNNLFEEISRSSKHQQMFIGSVIVKLSQKYIDREGNFVHFPHFLGESPSAEDRINYLEYLSSCEIKNQTKALQLIEDYTGPMRGDVDPELKMLLPNITFSKFGDHDIKKVVNALMNLGIDQFSFMSKSPQFLLNETCSNLSYGNQSLNFSLVDGLREIPAVAEDKSGKLKSIKGVLSDKKLDSPLSFNWEILNLIGGVAREEFFDELTKIRGLSVYNYQGLMDNSIKNIGVGIAEILTYKIGQHLAIINGGKEKFKAIESCFEKFGEFPQITEQCDSSFISPLLSRRIIQQTAIEGFALSARSIGDLVLEKSKISKGKETILSVIENLTRIAGIGACYGATSAIYSSIVPIALFVANINRNSSSESAEPAEKKLTQNSLASGVDSQEPLDEVSNRSNSIPKISIVGLRNQATIVFSMYVLSELMTSAFNDNSLEDDYQKKISFPKKIFANVLTAGVSSALMGLSSLALALFKKNHEMVEQTQPTIDSELGFAREAPVILSDLVFSNSDQNRVSTVIEPPASVEPRASVEPPASASASLVFVTL